MVTLPKNASSEEVLAVVREWCRVLDKEDYETAHAMTWHSPEDYWTPELMRTVISTYGRLEAWPDGKVFKITPCETAIGDLSHRHEVDWWDVGRNGICGDVWFDLPLNGEWSDLTATFWLRRLEDGLALELDDIHVM